MTPQNRLGQTDSRSGRLKWLIILFLITTFFVFRKSLLLLAVKIALSTSLGKTPDVQWGYDEIKWQGDLLYIKGFNWNSQEKKVRIDSAWIDLHLDLSTLKLFVKVDLDHPEVQLENTGRSGLAFPLFAAHPRVSIDWNMEHGVLQFPPSLTVNRLFFSFHPGKDPSQIGTLAVSYDPQGQPFLTADLFSQKNQYGSRFHLLEQNCGRIIPLLPFLSSSSSLQFKDAQGEIAIEAELIINSEAKIADLQAQIQGKNLHFTTDAGQKQLNLLNLKAEINYHPTNSTDPFLNQLSAQIFAQGGEWKDQNLPFALEQFAVVCSLSPQIDPKFQIDGILVQDDKKELFQMEADFLVEEGALKPTALRAQIGKIHGTIAIDCSNKDHLLDAQFEGNLSDFLWLALPECKVAATACRIHGALAKNESSWDCIGECLVGSDTIQWGVEVEGPTNLDQIYEKGLFWNLKEGWVRSEKLSESTYAPICASWMGNLQLSGNLDLFGTFNPSLCSISCQAEDLVVKHPWFSLHIPQMGEKDPQLLKTEGRALFSYDLKQHILTAEIPLKKTALSLKSLNLTFNDLDGTLQIQGDQLMGLGLMADCEGLKIAADLQIDHLGSDSCQISLETQKMQGSFTSLQQVMAHFPQLKLSFLPNMQGDFSSHQGGLNLKTQISQGLVDTKWTFDGQFSHLYIPISEQSHFSDVECQLCYDAHLGDMVIKNAGGTWHVADGSCYQVQFNRFEFNPQRSALFDFKILDASHEIGRFNGQLELNASHGWDLSFDQQSTHFFGTRLQMGKVVFNQDGKLLFFEMKPTIKIEHLQKQLRFIFSSGLFAAAEIDLNEIEKWQLIGEVQTDLKWQNNILNFQAQGKDLLIQGKKIGQFKLIGKKENNQWMIQHLQADQVNAKGLLDIQDKKVTFSELEGNWDQLLWKASAYYLKDQKVLHFNINSLQGDLAAFAAATHKLQGAFAMKAQGKWEVGSPQIEGECTLIAELKPPLNAVVKQESPIRFQYIFDQGLELKNLETKLYAKGSMQYLGVLRTHALMSQDQLDLAHIQFSFSPDLIARAIVADILSPQFQQLSYESYLEGRGDLHTAGDHLLFTGSLRDGKYGIQNHSFSLKQIGLSFENGNLDCQFKTMMNEKPLQGRLHVDLKGAPYGTLQLTDEPNLPGIQASFVSNNETLSWESIEGAACGLDIHLKKASASQLPQATVLTGSMKIDGSRLDAFFPKEMKEKFKNLKLGKGYEFRGDLLVYNDRKKGFQLAGQLLGEELELLGYQFKRMTAGIEATPESIQISRLNIEDAAGQFQIKKIAIDQNSIDQKWTFYIPLLQVKDLQPSLMKKIDNQTTAIKPLVIRNLSLSEIRGDLNDPRSWLGEGHLNFTNAFKKESTLFDTPIEMIKNFGLDPGLLTPIQGEIDIELHGDKFYLVNMKNSFSEGKRAQFFLSPADQISFIDLNGNIHIDIQMRQDVVLKITEALTLTVRGTLDKPRYGIKY